MSYKITFSYIILISLTISLLFSEQIKNCPNCNNDFKNSYNYCPIDGKQLNEKETSTKDIDGFQNYKWGMSIEETKMIDKSLSFKIDDSDPNNLTTNYNFQNNDCLLNLEFSNKKLYKVSLHFSTSDNQASINDYFSRANLIMDIYGETRKVAIGRESDRESSRKTSMSIGELTYQHRWETVSGKLTYQIGSGSYGKFIHSFFYSSKQAAQVDAKKLKSEF